MHADAAHLSAGSGRVHERRGKRGGDAVHSLSWLANHGNLINYDSLLILIRIFYVVRVPKDGVALISHELLIFLVLLGNFERFFVGARRGGHTR